MVTGIVKSINNGLKKIFNKAKTIATIIALQKLRICTPGVIHAVRTTIVAVTINFIRNGIILSLYKFKKKGTTTR